MRLLKMPAYTLMLVLLSSLYAEQSLGAQVVSTDVELSEGVRMDTNDDPWFCRGSPCPPFEVISKEQTYELREYSRSMFRCSDAPGTFSRCQLHLLATPVCVTVADNPGVPCSYLDLHSCGV